MMNTMGLVGGGGGGTSIGVTLSGGGSSTQTATTTGTPLVVGSTATFFKGVTNVGTAVANGSGVASLSISNIANGDSITVQGVTQGGSVTASVNAAVVSKNISRRTNIPGAQDSGTFGSETAAAGTIVITAPYDIYDLQVDFDTFRQKPQGSTSGVGALGSMTFAVAYEIPAGSGTLYNITWSGVSTKTATTGSRTGKSDINASIPPISAGTDIAIHTQITNATAFVATYSYRCCTAKGDRYQIGGTLPTIGSTLPNNTNKTSMPGPALIYAKTTSTKKTMLLYGDSNSVDQTVTFDSDGNSGLGRLAGLINCGFMTCNATGIQLQYNASSANAQPKMDEWVLGNAADAIVLLGTNDTNSGVSATTSLANLDTLAALFATNGIVPHFCTIPPLSAASGAIQTERNSFNAGIRSRSGTGNYGTYLELADLVETARDSNVWKTSSYQVGDGVHINWANTTVAAAILTDAGGLVAQLAAMGIS